MFKEIEKELSNRTDTQNNRYADRKIKQYLSHDEYQEKQRLLGNMEAMYQKVTADLKEVGDARKSLTDMKVTVRQELGLTMLQFAKSEAYQQFKERTEFLDNKYSQIKQTADICKEQLEKLREECREYESNQTVINFRDCVELSGLSEPDFRREQLLNKYGTIHDHSWSGFIFPDGQMLFMNYTEDHSIVQPYFEPKTREYNCAGDAILAFVSEGNIYWDPTKAELAIDMNVGITKEQEKQIREIVEYAQCVTGKLKIDVLVGDGVVGKDYDWEHLKVNKIMKDIEKMAGNKDKEIDIDRER